MSNYVYIAASIDGFIARNDGSIDWLINIENPDHSDYGYPEFINKIDAIVMGKNTFQFALKNLSWPYDKPVFVLSTTLKPGSDKLKRYKIVNLPPRDLVSSLKAQGLRNLYIDGGRTIQSFLAEGLIDELTVTWIPLLLGSGIPLFGNINKEIKLAHINTVTYKNGLVKSTYRRS